MDAKHNYYKILEEYINTSFQLVSDKVNRHINEPQILSEILTTRAKGKFDIEIHYKDHPLEGRV